MIFHIKLQMFSDYNNYNKKPWFDNEPTIIKLEMNTIIVFLDLINLFIWRFSKTRNKAEVRSPPPPPTA